MTVNSLEDLGSQGNQANRFGLEHPVLPAPHLAQEALGLQDIL